MSKKKDAAEAPAATAPATEEVAPAAPVIETSSPDDLFGTDGKGGGPDERHLRYKSDKSAYDAHGFFSPKTWLGLVERLASTLKSEGFDDVRGRIRKSDSFAVVIVTRKDGTITGGLPEGWVPAEEPTTE